MQDQDKHHIIIIGAGGHSKVVLSTLLAMDEKVLGFVDDDPKLINAEVAGYKILGNSTILHNMSGQAAILGIGSNQLRQKFASIYSHLNWKTAIHPSAYVHESAKVGCGTVVFAGAVIQPDSVIGKHVIINTAASIDHDCQIQDYAHIAPGSHLAGGVNIKEGSFIGIKSCAIFGVSVGKWSKLGAGSVIVHSIVDYACAKGVPAKVYKFNDNREELD